MKDYWKKNFLGCELIVALLITVGFATWSESFNGLSRIDKVLMGERAAVYGTVATIDGALLGFVIATVAIILGFAQSDRFAVLRASTSYEDLWTTLRSTIRVLAFATVAALVALLVDRETSPNSPALIVCFGFALLAVFRVARSIWVLENVIRIMTKPTSDSVSSGQTGEARLVAGEPTNR